jgi:hypothetical protein
MPTLTPDTPHTGWMRWIYQIPTPQTKILLACICTLGTFMWAWFGVKPDPVTLGLLLGFCTTLFGIASVDLNTKRKTDLDYQDAQVRKIEAAQPAPPESAEVKP